MHETVEAFGIGYIESGAWTASAGGHAFSPTYTSARNNSATALLVLELGQVQIADKGHATRRRRRGLDDDSAAGGSRPHRRRGLKIDATTGFEQALEYSERVRARLVLDPGIRSHQKPQALREPPAIGP
jgi:hypothetical protein